MMINDNKLYNLAKMIFLSKINSLLLTAVKHADIKGKAASSQTNDLVDGSFQSLVKIERWYFF